MCDQKCKNELSRIAEEIIVNPQNDEDFFVIARDLARRHSTCLKTQTAALIVDKNNRILSWGVNMCCPQDQPYGIAVSECPREQSTTGTSYALCMPIHAEIVACLNAFGISTTDRKNLWHFAGFTKSLKKYKGFFESKGAMLYLVGHYWACEECVEFLNSVGIEDKNIKFDGLSGGDTLRAYQEKGIERVGEAALDASEYILSGVVAVRISPQEVDAFSQRHHINLDEIKLVTLSEDDLFSIPVKTGEEKERVKDFEADEAVREANLLVTQSA